MYETTVLLLNSWCVFLVTGLTNNRVGEGVPTHIEHKKKRNTECYYHSDGRLQPIKVMHDFFTSVLENIIEE